MTTFQDARDYLRPKGTLPLVHLSLRNAGFVNAELVSEAIDALEVLHKAVQAGLSEPSGLERLATLLLMDSVPGERA